MEPFTIQCSTCQSLIRVRNPKMIGQIVNCPKCNSMLQIAEPQSNTARQIRVESHRGVIDSSAMTKEAFSPELEDEYRLAPSQTAEAEMNSAAPLIAPPRVDDGPVFETPFAAPPLPERKLASPQPLESNNIQLLAVRRTARRRQVLMVAVFGSSGVLFAGIAFVGFLYWYTSKPNLPIAKNSANANQGASEQKHVGPKVENEQDLVRDPLDTPEVDLLAEPAPSPITGDPNANSATESPSETIENVNSISSAIASADAAKPSGSDANVNEQPDAPINAVTDEAAMELPDQLKKFQNVLDKSIEPQFLEDQPVQKAPPTAKELGLSSGPDAKAIPGVDAGKQMQLSLTGLIIEPGTISNTVSQWVQVSGVPTIVDLDSLVAAGIDRYKPIGKIRVSDALSLAQIGASIAKEIGVDFNTIDNRFVAFQASEAAIREHVPAAIKITDLVADNDQQQWLVKTLNQIWPEYEGMWTVRDGELSVDPVAVDVVAWFWAVRMLESWRYAAEVETQLPKTKLEQSKFVTKFVDPEQLEALNKPLKSLVLVNRAPVAQLFSEVCSANEMHAWVDWASVRQKGLGPNTIDFIVTQGRTLRQCLRDLAEKYSLVIACEDDKSVVITTVEVYRAQPRLYVLPSQGKTAEQWMDELQPLTPATATAAQPVQAFLTPDSRFVIVRCCRPRIRF